MDRKFQELQRQFERVPNFSNLKRYIRSCNRIGRPVDVVSVASSLEKVITSLLPNGIIAAFDEGNWSQYTPLNRYKILMEIFWAPDPEVSARTGQTRHWTFHDDIRDICQVLFDLEWGIFEILDIEQDPAEHWWRIEHQDFGSLFIPSWVQEAEDHVASTLSKRLSTLGFRQGEVFFS